MPKITRPPKLSRHKASGQAYVTWKNRRHYLGKYGSKEAATAYARFIATLAEAVEEADQEEPASPPSVGWITVVELCAAYVQHAKEYYLNDGRPSAHVWRMKRRIDILVDHYAELPVNEFTAKRLKTIQEALVRKGYSRVGVNERIAAIRRIFKWGVSEDLVPAGVYHGLMCVAGLAKGRTAARETAPVTPADDATVEATLPYLPEIVADMVRFERLTGARPSEVCNIRPMDVDRSGDVWLYRPEHHKSEHLDKKRLIFIGPKAQDVLRPYLLRPADAYCFSPAESEKRRIEKMIVTGKGCKKRKQQRPHPPGDHYTKDTYARAVTLAIAKANKARREAGEAPLPSWSPNRLRHAAATEIRKTFGLDCAQVVLGHSKASTTEIYAELDAEKAKTVALRIG